MSLLTVVICTHNRSSDAITCVNTLLAAGPPAGIEVVVVDNASAPRQRERLSRWLQDKPAVRFASETRPGLSHARNHGLQLCASPWIAYLDDDAVPFDTWSTVALRAATEAAADVGFIAGAVHPLWPDTCPPDAVSPENLGERWRGLLSILERQPSDVNGTMPHVVGCNMLIRTDALRAIGGFDPNFGRRPGSLFGGEETDLAQRLHGRGLRVVFERELAVFHRIHAERLTPRWVARRAKAEGMLSARRSIPLRTLLKACLSLPILGAAVSRDQWGARSDEQGDRVVRLWHNVGFVLEAVSSRGRGNIRL